MKYRPVLLLLILFSLLGCHAGSRQQHETTVEHDPSTFINEKAVWRGQTDKCPDDTPENNCLINEIKKRGSPEAIKTVQYLAESGDSGYMSKFTTAGRVSIAEIEYPFRANTNTGTLLVPSAGSPIHIDDFYQLTRTDPTWIHFEKKHPTLMPWPPARLEKTEISHDGITLIYAYSIKSCHACEDRGSLYIRYHFTDKGKYMHSHVLNIGLINPF